MKKITLLLGLTIVIISQSFSQSYFKFPTSNAMWNYKIVGSLSYPYEWPVLIYLDQQVTIGSFQYTEVHWNSQGNTGVSGAIREDTLLKKVYFHNFTNEIVLYDFSLEVGDTIYYTTNLWYTLDYFKVVNNIDSININGQYRKMWHLTNSLYAFPDFWIEGIGSVYRYGLLYPNDPDIVMDASTPFFGCFAHDTIVYMNGSTCTGTCPCTGWLVNIDENDKFNEDIYIYPNPTTGHITIKNEELRMINVEVFDIYGKHLTGFQNLSGLNEIDLSQQAKGIYIIKVRTSKGVAVEKVVLE